MQVIDCTDYRIVVFGSELSESQLNDLTSQGSNVILVALDGCEDEYFPRDLSLVKNVKASFMNHMMWEGLLDDEEQIEYIKTQCARFFNTGKQMIIEDYDFQEDEPFYDYSK